MDSTSTQLFQTFLGKNFHSRKLLLFQHLNQTSFTAAAEAPPPNPSQSLDQNVFLVLSVLLCGLICTLGLNFVVRCALRCSSMAGSVQANDNPTPVVNKGIEQQALKTFTVVNFSAEMKLPGLDSECVICLSEFVPGERLRLLPKCNHGFHVRCIDKWLKSNSSCPKCRHCLIETCQKIMGCDNNGSAPAQESVVTILPMEPESMVRVYRG